MQSRYFDAKEQIEEYLRMYQSDNQLSDREMKERRKPEHLKRILPGYLLSDAKHYERYVNMMAETVAKLLSAEVKLKRMKQVLTHSVDFMACQELKGAHRLFSGFSGKAEEFLAVAERFAGKEFKQMNDKVFDSVCELLNTINGMYASELSNDDIMLEVFLPQVCTDSAVLSEGALFCLPAVIDGSEIDILLSFDSEVFIECGISDGITGANILIVDDSAIFRGSMREILESEGHNIIGEAGNGLEAVEKYMQLRPDLITMDITMPEKNGLTALKEIIDLDPDARIIMVSSTAQKSTVSEALINGAYGFLRKPLDPKEVAEMISGVMTFIN